MDRLGRRIRRALGLGLLALLAVTLASGTASARRHHKIHKKYVAARHRHVVGRHHSRQAPASHYVSRRHRRHGRELAFLGFDAAGMPRLRSRAAIVYDADSNQVLYSKNQDTRLPIASLTKIMTALVLLETEPRWDSTVAMAREDVHDASRTRLRAGEKIRTRDLFQLALMVSDNAATRALVRTSPMSHDLFVARMNSKAVEMGLTGTHFVEETGLDPENVSTARDYARLMAEACRNPLISEVTSTPHYEFRTSRGNHVLANTDRLLYGNYDILTGKTGFINEAGYCFATCVRSAGRSLVSVVLGSPTKGTRFLETARLIDWASTPDARLQAKLGN